MQRHAADRRGPGTRSVRSGGPGRLFEVRPSAIQGQGAFALRSIPRGTRVIEYVGERIDHAQADARYDDARMRRHHTYLFTVDDRTVIDAAVGGNAARAINHSCEPNCMPVIERGRVFIDARRAILPGEELTYDYALPRVGGEQDEPPDRYRCRCGARRCRGTMLSPRRERR